MKAEPQPSLSVEAAQDNDVVSLGEFLEVIRKRLWAIGLVAVVLAGAVVGFSLMQTPVYEASIQLLVGQERGITQTPNDVAGLQQLTKTMAKGVSSRPVAEAVIQQLNLRMSAEELLRHLNAREARDTQFIEVAYKDSSPEKAQLVANTVGDVFSKQVSEVSPSASAITATVWERAAKPEQPASPKPLRNGLLALAIGLVLGTGLAFLLEHLDDKWRSPQEAERTTGVPTFGIIPEFKAATGGKGDIGMFHSLWKARQSQAQEEGGAAEELTRSLVTVADPNSAASEAYRMLRTNLLYALVDNPPKVIAVTSPNPGEGKSTTCANLGVVLAQMGKSVLILDCDFRKPAIHNVFGLRNLYGVMDLLLKKHSLQEVWKEPVEGLKVVPVGPIPPNPAEILSTRRFSDFLTGAREEFDYVLVDTPPIGVVSDPVVLATRVDGVLLVLDAQNTSKEAARQSVHSLETVGANILGTVMNSVNVSRDSYYYHYGYTYKYGDYLNKQSSRR